MGNKQILKKIIVLTSNYLNIILIFVQYISLVYCTKICLLKINMENIIKYVGEVLGIEIRINKFEKEDYNTLPLFIESIYTLYETVLFDKELIVAKYKESEDFSIKKTNTHFALINEIKHKNVVLILDSISSIMRKRLIEKKISFIVPNKQLYLPELLIQLQERFSIPVIKKEKQKLLPSAQLILLYHFSNKEINLELLSFKQLAHKLNYTQMAITKAIDNLKQLSLITVEGEKEKFIRFKISRKKLWSEIIERNLFVNPVFKSVYIDIIPQSVKLLRSYTSALPEYSNMNPSKQTYFAIEKSLFYQLEKENEFLNINLYEGKYCLEVWKYNPAKLVENIKNEAQAVDPLSLYLCLKNSKDERIEMAIEQIIKTYRW